MEMNVKFTFMVNFQLIFLPLVAILFEPLL